MLCGVVVVVRKASVVCALRLLLSTRIAAADTDIFIITTRRPPEFGLGLPMRALLPLHIMADVVLVVIVVVVVVVVVVAVVIFLFLLSSYMCV